MPPPPACAHIWACADRFSHALCQSLCGFLNSVYARLDLDAGGACAAGVGLNAEQLLAEETKHLFDINGNWLAGLYGAV